MATTTACPIQPRRFSDGIKGQMRKRADLLIPQTSLYKRMYNTSSRIGEMPINEQFVRACEYGDYSTIHRILEENRKFSIDVTNQLGRSAMQLAIEGEHLEVVVLLLAHCDGQKMREALLLAIYLGHVQIAEACLRHPKFKTLNERRAFNTNENAFWGTPSSDDAQFPPDITPLILAAQYNRTEIVQLLLRGGDRITKPHDYHCKCRECHNKFKFDSLRHAQSRLNAYRGLASESYISIASIDPILTAFELGRELRDLSGKEKYFKNEYMNLADQLSAYAVKLLDKVRGHKELDCVLGKTGKETEEKYVLLARLYLAIKYEEKPFVAHSNCQQKLVEIWHSQIRNLFKLNPLVNLCLIILYIFILPFACVLYILTSWSKSLLKFQLFFKQPCIKFIGHTISYGMFIALIMCSTFSSAREFKQGSLKRFSIDSGLSESFNNSIFLYPTYNNCIIYPVHDFYYRSSSPTWIDIAISVFVIGFLWHEIKQAYNDGFQDYLLSWNNIVDSCMTILYFSSFALKYYVMGRVYYSNKALQDDILRMNISNICSLEKIDQENIYYTFYWLNADRFYWVPLDPVNVAEGLFAIANIFSFSRICFLLPAFQHLGPLQISLGRMMSDIGKFIIIFSIIFCGFMFGLNNLFWYYRESVRKEVEIKDHKVKEDDDLPAEEFFGTMGSTFKTVFWSLFGLAEKEGVQLDQYNNQFTEIVGYLIYGAFNIACVIVLLNMLIAMMSKSYETIEEHADVEWKFARSKLYMEYIKEGGTLPVPFNIIPTPKSVYHLCRRIFSCIKKLTGSTVEEPQANDNGNTLPPMIRPSGGGARRSPYFIPNSASRLPNGMANGDNLCRTRQGSFDVNQNLTYRKVMERVIKRFLLHKQREEQEEIREGDFEELKQDIQMLRFELLHRLDEARDDLRKNTHLLNDGVLIIGELLSGFGHDTNPLVKENFHLFKKSFYSRTDSGMESNTSTLSSSSMPSLSQQAHLPILKAISYSSSKMLPNNPQESDNSSTNVMRPIVMLGLKLSEIEEEEDENKYSPIRFIDHDDDEEEEVEARHMSVQTTPNKNNGFISKF